MRGPLILKEICELERFLKITESHSLLLLLEVELKTKWLPAAGVTALPWMHAFSPFSIRDILNWSSDAHASPSGYKARIWSAHCLVAGPERIPLASNSIAQPQLRSRPLLESAHCVVLAVVALAIRGWKLMTLEVGSFWAKESSPLALFVWENFAWPSGIGCLHQRCKWTGGRDATLCTTRQQRWKASRTKQPACNVNSLTEYVFYHRTTTARLLVQVLLDDF